MVTLWASQLRSEKVFSRDRSERLRGPSRPGARTETTREREGVVVEEEAAVRRGRRLWAKRMRE